MISGAALHGIRWYALLLVLAGAWGCAQKGRPTGGPPDTTPPTVMSMSPASGTVGVDRTVTVAIEFSEPIDRRTFLPNFFVSPRPGGSPETEWSKGSRIVRVEWPDSLNANTTYRVTVGAQVADQHNNKFTGARTFAFSTGTKIDRGYISGRVRDARGAGRSTPVYEIHAYDLDRVPDTFWLVEPDYLTQTGEGSADEEAGSFDLPFLRSGRYRVMAFGDKDRDHRLDPGESYGLPRWDPTLTEAALADTLEIFVSVHDTADFCLSECGGNDWGGLTVVFSQPVDTSRWDISSFRMINIDTADTIYPSVLRPANRRPAAVSLLSEEMELGQRYRVEIAGVWDRRGRPLCRDALCALTLIARTDTVGPKIEWVHLPGARKGLTPTDRVILQFDEPVDTVRAGRCLSAADTADVPVAGRVAWDDARTLVFAPEGFWPEEMPVTMTLDSSKLTDPAGNSAPSQAFTWSFTPVSSAQMGTVEGSIEVGLLTADSATCRLTLQQVTGILKVTRTFRVPGRYSFDAPAGRWVLDGFLDRDHNGHWSPGTLAPFSFPEPRLVRADTLVIRPRFTVEDVNVRF